MGYQVFIIALKSYKKNLFIWYRMAYVKKMVKRAVKAVGKAVKRRYFKGKGYTRPKIQQMVNDVRFLKSIVNAEKHKQIYASTSDLGNVVGQVSGNSSGHWALDVTPNLTQGVGTANRIGSSIKWHASNWRFMFKQQSSAQSAMRIRMMLVQVKGVAQSSVSNIISSMYDGNPFVVGGTIYDTNAPRNQDNFKNFYVLKSKTFTLRADDYSTQTNIKGINFGYKFRNHHVKWDGDSATVVGGQVVMFIFADSGNCNTVTASTLTNGVVFPAINTGASFQFIQTHYYYDN